MFKDKPQQWKAFIDRAEVQEDKSGKRFFLSFENMRSLNSVSSGELMLVVYDSLRLVNFFFREIILSSSIFNVFTIKPACIKNITIDFLSVHNSVTDKPYIGLN